MYHNFTRTTQPTEAEMAERIRFFEQSMREADRLNAEFMLAGEQQRAFEQQQRLIDATGLSIETLVAIRAWLQANP
jgi:hypothetical protein